MGRGAAKEGLESFAWSELNKSLKDVSFSVLCPNQS